MLVTPALLARGPLDIDVAQGSIVFNTRFRCRTRLIEQTVSCGPNRSRLRDQRLTLKSLLTEERKGMLCFRPLLSRRLLDCVVLLR